MGQSFQSSNSGYGDVESSLKYWKNNRQTIEQLYASERFFFEQIASKSQNILDLGCAAGGGARFTRELSPQCSYTGIDVSDALIRLAKEKNPNDTFLHYNGLNIPFTSSRFDLVYSFGVLHHLPHYFDVIEEMLRVGSKYILFDLRVHLGDTLNNPNEYFQKIDFENCWDQKTKIPYIVLNCGFLNQQLEKLSQNKSVKVQHFGNWVKVTSSAVLPVQKVFAVSLLIQKNIKAPFEPISIG